MLTYNNFKRKLENRYVVVPYGNAKFYVDENDKLAAYEKDNAITTWHQCDKYDLGNHYDCVAVTITKGMDLPSKKSYKGYARYDALYVVGLCGASNCIKRFDTYAIDSGYSVAINLDSNYVPARKPTSYEEYLSNKQKILSKIYTTCDGEDISVVYQEDFDRLTYDQKISFLDDRTGAHFSGAKIDGIKVLPFKSEKRCAGGISGTAKVFPSPYGIVYFGKAFRWGDSFHIENDIFQINIPVLSRNREGFNLKIPVVKLKKYKNVSPPDVEISINRWGYTDKIYNSMVDSVWTGEKPYSYQKSLTFRRR